MARPLLLAILMVSASLSGCFGEEETLAPEVEADLGNVFRPYTVIAPIDTGINPFDKNLKFKWPIKVKNLSKRDSLLPIINKSFKGL